MADEILTGALLGGSFAQLASFIGAAGGLGMAAAGIVDATKARANGGISNIGFSYITTALSPFDAALTAGVGGNGDWKGLLHAHWINGRPKSDQKGIARALVRLGLTVETFGKLAETANIDKDVLKAAALAVKAESKLNDRLQNALGRLDMVVEARLDAAFERAEQAYRNKAKLIAGVLAIILAIIAGGVLFADSMAAAAAAAGKAAPLTGKAFFCAYVSSREFVLALLLGIIAVPVAPVSKDLVSALTSAANGLKSVRGRTP